MTFRQTADRYIEFVKRYKGPKTGTANKTAASTNNGISQTRMKAPLAVICFSVEEVPLLGIWIYQFTGDVIKHARWMTPFSWAASNASAI